MSTSTKPALRPDAHEPTSPSETRSENEAGLPISHSSDLLVANVAHRSVVERAPSGGIGARACFAEIAGSRRGACWRPDPRRLASTLGWSVA
jgi:hypothetical protein